MAQNAANIEQEAAEEEAMLAAMEEELPTDEELEAQLYGEGFVGFEDDDDDYEDDGLDESEEDMTAEAMAESDAASAMADASNPPELDEPAVLAEKPALQPEKPVPDSEEPEQIDEQPDIPETRLPGRLRPGSASCKTWHASKASQRQEPATSRRDAGKDAHQTMIP